MDDDKPHLLHLTHRVPYPPDKGDRIRTFNMLKDLSSHCHVHLACLADEPVPKETEDTLDQLCHQVAIVPVSKWMRWPRAMFSFARGQTITAGAFSSPTLRKVLRQWTQRQKFDVALASASSLVPYLRMKELRDVPAVVDLMDVDSQKWFDYSAASQGMKSWLYRREGSQMQRLEKALPTWARGVLLTTQREVSIFEKFAGPGTAFVVENGVNLEYFQPVPDSEELSCAFVGALDYRPNVDGIIWFCEKVWPQIYEKKPDAKLFVVGRRPVASVQELDQRPGVEVVGEVPDVRPWVARAGVIVVPLHIARGVQNKVLEALAMAKPVVASPLCLGGLATEIGTHLLGATEPDEWTISILELWSDPQARQRLGTAGRTYVQEHHCWERTLQPLRDLLFSELRSQ